MDNLVTRNAVTNFQYYYYQPSMAAAILFVILFFLGTSLHIYQMIRTRTWFMVPFVIGGCFETIGYIGRTLSASENPGPYSEGAYITQAVLLLVAPAFFAASIYMELGRIVLMVRGEKLLFIRRTWLTKIFVIGDVISFLLQAGGAGLLASGVSTTINIGQDIVVAGLVAQVLFFGLFVIAAAVFHMRLANAPTQVSFERPWKKHMLGLYIVSILIFMRSIVRVVEYVEGFNGYIMQHEVFLYVFDATVIFFAVVAMNWAHPGDVAKWVRQVRQEEKEKMGGGVEMRSGNAEV